MLGLPGAPLNDPGQQPLEALVLAGHLHRRHAVAPEQDPAKRRQFLRSKGVPSREKIGSTLGNKRSLFYRGQCEFLISMVLKNPRTLISIGPYVALNYFVR